MQSPLLRQFAFLLMLLIALSWGVWLVLGEIGFYLIAFFAVGGSVFLLSKAFLNREKFDPYDLGELKRLQEKEEIHELHEELRAKDPAYILCISCQDYYSSDLPTCPRCQCCR